MRLPQRQFSQGQQQFPHSNLYKKNPKDFPDTEKPLNPNLPGARKRGRPLGSTKSEKKEDDYVVPSSSKVTDLDTSCVASRTRKRKREFLTEARPREEREFSSSDESATESGNEESSDPPVFRKSHSVFPSLPLHPSIRQSPSASDNNPKPPLQSEIPPLSNQYTDVYVDGACCDNGGVRPRAGIGVWFGPDHPLNVSRRYRGRQTNNASEIEAATEAIRQAKRAGIDHLRIKTDSKVLLQGIQEWVPKWQTND